jgi:tRNA threonylcarbamoyladenosine biosynthesis protein TsaB
MKVLGLDTSTDSCSVALYDAHAQRLLAEERVLIERGHAEILFAQIARVTQRAELGLKAVDRFAVTTGPGTFTGVRIGLSAARGLALAAGRPLVGLNSLEVTAFAADASPEAIIVAAFDARRGEIYAQGFRGGGTPVTEPFAASAEAGARTIMRSVPPGARLELIGSGAEALRSAFAKAGVQSAVVAGDPLPSASALARLAAARPIPAARPKPLYLRAPDAKLPADALRQQTSP